MWKRIAGWAAVGALLAPVLADFTCAARSGFAPAPPDPPAWVYHVERLNYGRIKNPRLLKYDAFWNRGRPHPERYRTNPRDWQREIHWWR